MKTLMPLSMAWPKWTHRNAQGSGQKNDVTRPEAVHGLLVGVEPEELPVGRNIDLGGIITGDSPIRRPIAGIAPDRRQRLVAALEPVLEHVGHGHELDRAALRGQRIGRGAGAAAPATNQGKLDRVVLTGMHRRDGHPCQGRRRNGPSRVPQKFTPRRTWHLGDVHEFLLRRMRASGRCAGIRKRNADFASRAPARSPRLHRGSTADQQPRTTRAHSPKCSQLSYFVRVVKVFV